MASSNINAVSCCYPAVPADPPREARELEPVEVRGAEEVLREVLPEHPRVDEALLRGGHDDVVDVLALVVDLCLF